MHACLYDLCTQTFIDLCCDKDILCLISLMQIMISLMQIMISLMQISRKILGKWMLSLWNSLIQDHFMLNGTAADHGSYQPL